MWEFDSRTWKISVATAAMELTTRHTLPMKYRKYNEDVIFHIDKVDLHLIINNLSYGMSAESKLLQQTNTEDTKPMNPPSDTLNPCSGSQRIKLFLSPATPFISAIFNTMKNSIR